MPRQSDGIRFSIRCNCRRQRTDYTDSVGETHLFPQLPMPSGKIDLENHRFWVRLADKDRSAIGAPGKGKILFLTAGRGRALSASNLTNPPQSRVLLEDHKAASIRRNRNVAGYGGEAFRSNRFCLAAHHALFVNAGTAPGFISRKKIVLRVRQPTHATVSLQVRALLLSQLSCTGWQNLHFWWSLHQQYPRPGPVRRETKGRSFTQMRYSGTGFCLSHAHIVIGRCRASRTE